LNKTPKSGGEATAFWRSAAKPHETFFCCNLNFRRAENGVEVFALPVSGVVKTTFSLVVKEGWWLKNPFGRFCFQKIKSAATAHAKWGTIVVAFFVGAIFVAVL
jgi:hypothetical protein